MIYKQYFDKQLRKNLSKYAWNDTKCFTSWCKLLLWFLQHYVFSINDMITPLMKDDVQKAYRQKESSKQRTFVRQTHFRLGDIQHVFSFTISLYTYVYMYICCLINKSLQFKKQHTKCFNSFECMEVQLLNERQKIILNVIYQATSWYFLIIFAVN